MKCVLWYMDVTGTDAEVVHVRKRHQLLVKSNTRNALSVCQLNSLRLSIVVLKFAHTLQPRDNAFCKSRALFQL